jgi:mannose PTS system EIIC component
MPGAFPTVFHILLAGFFFVLFSSFRFALNPVILERPLAVGFFWGAIFGDMGTSLSVALFFELFWLDLIPAGTYIPPNPVASTLAALSVMHSLNLSSPSQALFAVALSVPLARLFSKVEDFQREYEDKIFDKFQGARGKSGAVFAPGALVLRSIVDMAVINGIVFCLVLTALTALAAFLAPRLLPLAAGYPVSWAQIWILGSLGAVFSLRYRPAYAALLVSVALAAAWYMV